MINISNKIDSDKLEDFTSSTPELEKYWKDRITRLISVRNKLIKESEYSFGDIVINRRNNELGLVLGCFDPKIDFSKSSPKEEDLTGLDLTNLFASSFMPPTPSPSVSFSPKKEYNKNQYYLLVTTGEDVGDALKLCSRLKGEGGSGETTNLIKNLPKLGIFEGCRVRYVKRKYIQKFDILTETSSFKDLEEFCKYQCIMDCSKDCALYKFGCYPKDKK